MAVFSLGVKGLTLVPRDTLRLSSGPERVTLPHLRTLFMIYILKRVALPKID